MKTKTEFLTALQAKHSGLSRQDLASVLDSIGQIVIDALKTEGVAVIPGVVKLKAVKKAATPEKPGINPFTKQPITVKAKPESVRVKVSPQKMIKEAVE
jgi:DNA-binding protein HU-beta